jgi:hypothetical protein
VQEPIESRLGALLFLRQVLLAARMGAENVGLCSFAWACGAILRTLAGLGMPATSGHASNKLTASIPGAFAFISVAMSAQTMA